MALSEKLPIIQNASNALSTKDETVLNKHLAKLNQLEDDLKGYKEILNKMDTKPASAAIEAKYNEAQAQLNEMQQQIEDRKRMLALQAEALEFDRESAELVQQMNEKRAQAQSEDYGQDYEHLSLIKAKFGSLRDEVKSYEPRYARLRKLSSDLLNSKSPEAKLIRKRVDELKATRELLEEDLNNREQILNSAAEIHRFNKDVQDLLRRINEKEMAFVNDFGRDFHSCASFDRKHQTYIEELTALKVISSLFK